MNEFWMVSNWELHRGITVVVVSKGTSAVAAIITTATIGIIAVIQSVAAILL